MSIQYNTLNVDERYSAILEPNLYYNPILVPGVTCTDKYETGPAGQIYVHKLSTSAVEAGTPGRDFTDEVASDTLIPIQLNNNFQKSKKIYEQIVAIHNLEEQGDKRFLNCMRRLHTECTDLLEIIGWREVFVYMERCADSCEHVADVMANVIMENI